MSEELGKIEKPSVEEFKEARKLYFVPLLYAGPELPVEYLEKYNRYWSQVENQVDGLETKIGEVKIVYHELVLKGGEDGCKEVEVINVRSYETVKRRMDKGAKLQSIEDSELLTELMDWSKCLAVGLQNQRVFVTVYNSYVEAGKKRNESIAKRIDQTLKPGEAGVLFMREGYQVQFSSDIQVFYVAPPALDELRRWLRDRESAQKSEKETEGEKTGD